MRVKILVEFNVQPVEGDALTEREAKEAAELAAFHNLVLTANGRNIVEAVEHHVDGLGECRVTL